MSYPYTYKDCFYCCPPAPPKKEEKECCCPPPKPECHCKHEYEDKASYEDIQAQIQAQAQAQLQAQRQRQFQLQDQDQDQNQKTIFKDIGNPHVDVHVDNVSVAVAVLVAVEALLGGIGATEVREFIDSLKPRNQ